MSSYDLPHEDNIYGMKQTGSGEGAAEVVYKLSVHKPSSAAMSDQDIVKCNRMAVQRKLITAKDQYDFQLANQHVKKIKGRIGGSNSPKIPSEGPFGVPSYPRPMDGSGERFRPPSNSIDKVINNEYAGQPKGIETYPDMSNRFIPGKMPPPKDTNANRLKHMKANEPPAEKPRFVMKKFQNVQSRAFN